MNNMIQCPSCCNNNVFGPLQKHREPGIPHEFLRYKCHSCGVEFWTPLVMPPSSFYEQAIGDYEEFHDKGSDVIKWWHKSFLDHFPGLDAKGRILDIGCADGRLLKKLKTVGWEIYGLDLDKKSVEVARRNCQTDNIYHCYFDEFIGMVEPNSFDIVTCFEVLEHQPDPIAFINGVKKLLKPTGWIAGSVPNTDRYIVSHRFSPDNPPHHFTLWNRKSLSSFLKRNGFNHCEIYPTRYALILVDQIIRSFFFDTITVIKRNNQVKTFDELSRKNNILKFVIFCKKYLYSIIKYILSVIELPYLMLTKKSVSMYFQSKLN